MRLFNANDAFARPSHSSSAQDGRTPCQTWSPYAISSWFLTFSRILDFMSTLQRDYAKKEYINQSNSRKLDDLTLEGNDDQRHTWWGRALVIVVWRPLRVSPLSQPDFIAVVQQSLYKVHGTAIAVFYRIPSTTRDQSSKMWSVISDHSRFTIMYGEFEIFW